MLSGSPKQSPRSSPLISTIRQSEAENNICQKRGWCFKQTFHFEVISNMPENTACRFQLELHRIQLFEKNESISSCRRFASDSVSLPRLDSPGVCPTSHRQWADFLVPLVPPLHRQYKTARTETRWHLLLKTWQMPIQTSASRGYVLLSGGTRGTHKSPKIVCWLADTVRGVFQTWKDTDHRRWQARHG